MTKRHRQLTALRDYRKSKHKEYSGVQRELELETHKILKREMRRMKRAA